MEQKDTLKDTLNLPKTSFPMKADLPRSEPKWLEFWEKLDVYGRSCAQTRDCPAFILHDGPPYANGDIHVGTAMNKILKDIVVKYRSMSGHYSPYVPGWDCHGQPIEHHVEKRLKDEKRKVDQIELRRLSRQYALDFVDRQSGEFQRLGVRGDFRNPYLTLDPAYEATNVRVFGDLYRRGLIYKGRKPIHWCTSCQTALAEAEIEYSDEESPSIYVKFPLVSEFEPLKSSEEPKFMVIWTTTPWTLPANVAVAVHPQATYVAARSGGEILIVAKDLLDDVAAAAGLTGVEVLAEFKGAELERQVCEQPLQDWTSLVVLADYVALDTGSGAVHIAPGHGQEDYRTGLDYDLPSPMPVDERGYFTEEAGRFSGQEIHDANRTIVDYLAERGLLIHESTVEHSYPHCWRCKRPVVFRSTAQWFVDMDKAGLRQEALEAIGGVKWIPGWSINRISAMVKERPDWCISRQRSWGVPIPAFYCASCGEIIVTDETIELVEGIFRTDGADSWFEREAGELLPPGFTCPACGKSGFRKETDILDVWFESGISHAAVLRSRSELSWPADLYLEGSDQHRGWFQSSLLASVGAERAAPYRAVLTHGFVVDGEGRKMSKSLGNVIDPLEVMQQYGADILRLWVASADYSVDVAISSEILDHMADAYRRIRNTLRFLLGNLYDFDPSTDQVPAGDLAELDRFALHRLNKLIAEVTDAYESYRFHLVFHKMHNYATVDLSAFYLDIIKDRLYTSEAAGPARRGAQTVLWRILTAMLKLLTPVLAFTSEEAWQEMAAECCEAESVQLAGWVRPDATLVDDVLEERWQRLIAVRGEVLKLLEAERNQKTIGNSLEAAVNLYADQDVHSLLQPYLDGLPALFIVSSVTLSRAEESPSGTHVSEVVGGLGILVKRAKGEKCSRCWNYRTEVGQLPEYPTLCERCAEVVSRASGGRH